MSIPDAASFLAKFREHFHTEPDAAAEAPGRLEILGNHTDYNEGFVLSCAVAQTTRFALRVTGGTRCRLVDFRDGSRMNFDLADLDAAPDRNGSRYVKGMVRELAARGFTSITGFDAAIESTVPLSAGMSSSAALEVAAGYALGKAFGIDLPGVEWARAGQGVENNYLKLHTGLLDQFSSIFGRQNALIMSDFRTNEVLRTVALPPGYSIVVVHSMKKHNLVDSEYNARRADCEAAAAVLQKLYPGVKTLRDVSMKELEAAKDELPRRAYLRARHVVGECERVMRAEKALGEGDVAAFGQLLFESHESSRVNFENSSPELDYLVELARSIPGCLGARLSGGGFGCISIHLVETREAGNYARRIGEGFKAQQGILPETIICAIGDGARLI